MLKSCADMNQVKTNVEISKVTGLTYAYATAHGGNLWTSANAQNFSVPAAALSTGDVQRPRLRLVRH